MKGIEPLYAAWEAAVLPLNYTRIVVPLSGGAARMTQFTADRVDAAIVAAVVCRPPASPGPRDLSGRIAAR